MKKVLERLTKEERKKLRRHIDTKLICIDYSFPPFIDRTNLNYDFKFSFCENEKRNYIRVLSLIHYVISIGKRENEDDFLMSISFGLCGTHYEDKNRNDRHIFIKQNELFLEKTLDFLKLNTAKYKYFMIEINIWSLDGEFYIDPFDLKKLEPISEDVCIVCYSQKPNVTFNGCNHICVCDKCLKNPNFGDKCPLCRQKNYGGSITHDLSI